MVLKTREKLIEVARQLFVHKGLENTTMNDIANASDKGRRTIYTYFRNKKEIYNAVLEHESDMMVSKLREIAMSADEPVVQLTKFLALRLEQGRTIVTTYTTIKNLFKFDVKRMDRIRRLVHDKEVSLLNIILDRGVDDGSFDAGRVALLRGFVVKCLQCFDFDGIGDAARLENSRQANNDFINFIISDISVVKTRTAGS
jgi:hypothetical protein